MILFAIVLLLPSAWMAFRAIPGVFRVKAGIADCVVFALSWIAFAFCVAVIWGGLFNG